MTLEDLQKKFETQAAVAELLKMLRPNMVGGSGSGSGSSSGSVADQTAAGSLSGASAAAAAALLRSHVLPPQLHQQLLLRQEQAHQQLLQQQVQQVQQLVVARQGADHLKYPPAVAAAPSAAPSAPALTTPPSVVPAVPNVATPVAVAPGPRHAASQSAVTDAPAGGHLEPAQSLSIEREWDWEKVRDCKPMLIYTGEILV